GTLYASTTIDIKRLDGNTLTTLPVNQFMPDALSNYIGYFYRQAFMGSSMAYISDNGTQDHAPFGLYVTSGPNQSRKVTLPADAKPRDLLTRPEGVYLLTSTGQSGGLVKNTV